MKTIVSFFFKSDTLHVLASELNLRIEFSVRKVCFPSDQDFNLMLNIFCCIENLKNVIAQESDSTFTLECKLKFHV